MDLGEYYQDETGLWHIGPDGSRYVLIQSPMTSPTALRGYGAASSSESGGSLFGAILNTIAIGTAVEVLAHALKRALFT
jgi:hypothetical protein